MPIFIAPDRTQYPGSLNAQICPELETLTGADLAITQLPLPITKDTLQIHIKRQALFVQIKIGYDILSFDNLKSSIARIQKYQIPMPQAILLFIGRDWQDDNGLLRIENNRPYGETTYKTFLKLKAKWRARGGTIDWLNNIEQLPLWIEAQQEVIENVREEGKREIYPHRQVPVFEPDDVWQLVEEIPKDTWEYFLCAGLNGFGQKTVQAIRDYFKNELLIPPTGYQVLKMLTDEDEKGAVHKIKGWGKKKRKTFRDILFLPPGWNLEIKENELDFPYQAGWQAALSHFKTLIDNGHNGKDAFNACAKLAREVIEF